MIPQRIGVVGASGFIGSACVETVGVAHQVIAISAPRLVTEARSIAGLILSVSPADLDRFAASQLSGVDVLVNAAGIATASSGDLSALLSANAILPLFLARAAALAGVSRLIHVSSAAVQGRGTLDETERMAPENHYALSKALGEALLEREAGVDIVRYRPTSVHGPSRSVTRALLRVAESPLAAVAAPGDDPSPQMPVHRAAEAISLLVDPAESPPRIVLHPWEGPTTRSVLNDLGGREPREVDRVAARRAVESAYVASKGIPWMRANARRLDLMLFGQDQAHGWLSDRLAQIPSDWLAHLRREARGLGEVGRA